MGGFRTATREAAVSICDPCEFWGLAKALNRNPASKIIAATIKLSERDWLESDTEPKSAFR